MDESNFEGTQILETLNEKNLLEAFYEAIDSDNFQKARKLMQQANIDAETIAIVLKKMAAPDGDH